MADECEMDEETRAWLDAELTPPLEPYDWGGEDPLAYGQRVEYVPGEGLYVIDDEEEKAP